MERAVIIGNCQAKALETVLGASRAFDKRFEFMGFPAVHEIPEQMVPQLHQALSSAGVAILQLVDEGYRDGIGLGTETLTALATDATVIRWPNIYWIGYFPDLCYLYDEKGRHVLDGPTHYHDRSILTAFNDGITATDTCELLADPDRPSDAASAAANAIAELERREQRCDVQVSPFIASEYRRQLLFFTMNHPTNRMLGLVAERICELVGIDSRIDYGRIAARRWRRRGREILGETFFPLHANHARALGLELDRELVAGDAHYRFHQRTFEPVDAIQAYFDYYNVNRHVIELNLQRSTT